MQRHALVDAVLPTTPEDGQEEMQHLDFVSAREEGRSSVGVAQQGEEL